MVRRRHALQLPLGRVEPHAPRQEARRRARVALHHDALPDRYGQLPLSIIFVDEAAGLDEEGFLIIQRKGTEGIAPR